MTDHIISAYRSGASLRDIARAHSISISTVHRILVAHGEPRRGVGAYPRAQTAAQLERDRRIRDAYKAGLSMHGVARQLRLSTSLVWKVLAQHNEPRRPPRSRQRQ
jgi:transposase-like protein